MRVCVMTLAFVLSLGVSPALAASPDHPNDQPLQAAADVGFAPFAYKTPSGDVTGFSVDVAKELASRLGRPGVEIVDVNYAAIFAGLFAERYEFILAPTNVTQERAEQMLFTEPYMPTGLGFLVREGEPEITDLHELNGKVVTVNSGSVSDTWATANAEKYGFTVQRYNKNTFGVQAVITRRAYANIADVPVTRYVAVQNPRVKVGYFLANGNNFGLAFRNDDADFRNQVERVLECMKLDGTMAELHQNWFGSDPDPGLSMASVYAGYGAPGFPGYTLDYHVPSCHE